MLELKENYMEIFENFGSRPFPLNEGMHEYFQDMVGELKEAKQHIKTIIEGFKGFEQEIKPVIDFFGDENNMKLLNPQIVKSFIKNEKMVIEQKQQLSSLITSMLESVNTMVSLLSESEGKETKEKKEK